MLREDDRDRRRQPGRHAVSPTWCTTTSARANVETIRDWLAAHDIILAGRYSEWEYYNSDHAFVAGRKAAEQARARPARRQGGGRLVAV